ncbi:MAG TPA: trigger factor, partial [Lachnospiraceae bacterium]|nr:trigger factor [Lachnospiraceae bacterium]
DTYLQSYMGLDEESFNEKVQEASQTIAKQSLVLQAIADAEEIEITDEELEQKVNDLVDLYGYESEKDLKEHMSVDDIKESMLIKKVEEFLADHAVITVSE